jgi:hypothetical protein
VKNIIQMKKSTKEKIEESIVELKTIGGENNVNTKKIIDELNSLIKNHGKLKK